jgi:hypothetical protein
VKVAEIAIYFAIRGRLGLTPILDKNGEVIESIFEKYDFRFNRLC